METEYKENLLELWHFLQVIQKMLHSSKLDLITDHCYY